MTVSDFFSKRSGADLGEIGHDELTEALQSKSCMLVDVREAHECSGLRQSSAFALRPASLARRRADRVDLRLRKTVGERARSGARSGTYRCASLPWRRCGLATRRGPSRLTGAKRSFQGSSLFQVGELARTSPAMR